MRSFVAQQILRYTYVCKRLCVYMSLALHMPSCPYQMFNDSNAYSPATELLIIELVYVLKNSAAAAANVVA